MKKLVFIFCFLLSMESKAQYYYRDSMIKALQNAKDDTSRIVTRGLLAYYYSLNQVDSGMLLANQAIREAQQAHYKYGEFVANRARFFSYNSVSNYNKVLEIALANLSIAKAVENNRMAAMSTALTDLSLIDREMSAYDESLANCRESIRIQEANHDVGWDCWDCRGAYFSLTIIFLQQKKMDSVLFFAQKGFDGMAGSPQSRLALCLAYAILGNTHLAMGHVQTAEGCFRNGIASATKYNTQYLLARLYFNFANLFRKTGRIDSALHYAQASLAICTKYKYANYALDASSVLANIYESHKNSDSALKYVKLMLTSDSIFNQQKVQQFVGLLSDEKQRSVKEQAARQQYKDRIRIYSLLIALVIFSLIAFLLYRNNKQNQKANKVLQLQKEEIEQQRTKAEATLEELKSAQEQLIQSEKMASLGELTAGIAHEIQNPLNFVNNFSEVNKELIAELREEQQKDVRNAAFENNILKDIEQNEEKIGHHGKRAEAIVKAMLLHSNVNTSQKEMVDLNALADEYLRISYHGFRARDKKFNASLETNYDETIGKINIVPQDMGKALINLFNNAFYAVNEKAKFQDNAFEPQVAIKTKKIGDWLEVRIRDNGNGIPRKILDKIFQPFFTTKPTGQGTGLGLSLAYDIITKEHGGQLKVETREGEYAEFIIIL